MQRILSTSATRSVGVAVIDVLSPRSEAVAGDTNDKSLPVIACSGVRSECVVDSSGDIERDVRDSLSSLFPCRDVPRHEEVAAGFRLALLALLALEALSGLVSLLASVLLEAKADSLQGCTASAP